MSQQRVWREYFDNEYLTGDALAAEGTTFTIADKARAAVENTKGELEHKLVLAFTNGSKWLTNVTNCSFMTQMLGSNQPADWIGKRVTLQFDPTVKFGKDVVGGIRVIGSPDITEPVKFMFAANSRQKPRQVTLKPTATGPDDAPHTAEAAPSAQGGVATSEDGTDGFMPGRGPKSDQEELS